MFICQCCGIKINTDTEPGKCPKCPNSDAEKFVSLSPVRICDNCATDNFPFIDFPTLDIVNDETGKCLVCKITEIAKFGGMSEELITKIIKEGERITNSEPEPEKIKRVCSNCENEVLVSETTGECPFCNQNAVFTEPEHDAPGLKAVDRYAGETVVVDPDNLLVDDSETGFNHATESDVATD